MAFVIELHGAPSLQALPGRNLIFFLEGKAGSPAAEVSRTDVVNKFESQLDGSGIPFDRKENFAGDTPRYFTFEPARAHGAGFAIVGSRFVLIVSLVPVSEAVEILDWNDSAAWVTAIGSSNDSDRREMAHAVEPLKLRLASKWHDTSESDACALARQSPLSGRVDVAPGRCTSRRVQDCRRCLRVLSTLERSMVDSRLSHPRRGARAARGLFRVG